MKITLFANDFRHHPDGKFYITAQGDAGKSKLCLGALSISDPSSCKVLWYAMQHLQEEAGKHYEEWLKAQSRERPLGTKEEG